MAAGGRIAGITIQLGADTRSLTAALTQANTAISRTQKELKMVERALQLDPGNAELLRQQQELLQEAVSETTTKLDALRQAQAEVERKFQAGEISATEYRSFQRELITTEQRLNGFSQQLAELGQDAQEAGRDVEQMAQGMRDAGDGIKDAGGKMMGVTAGLGAVAGAAGMAAVEFDNMSAKIRNSVNATEEELAGLEDAAKNVWREGFGESMEDVSNSIVQVKNNMKGLTGEEIEQATKSAMVLGQTFDADVNEVTRAGNNLMVNFGITSDEAFDMMAAGAKSGLNFSNEMFDNLAEYTPLFAEMGYSAEEYFGILKRGSEAGVYNLDGINDIMKEFQIISKDGSDATATAFADLKKETQDVWDAYYYGEATVKDLATAVVADLQDMEDQTYANQLGVTLFGTKWEDMEADAVYAMLGVNEGMENTKGTMNEMIETQDQTFGQRFQSMLRQTQEALMPLGEILLNLATKYLPPIIEKITALGQWFASLSSQSQLLVVGIGAFAAAIGPLVIIIGTIVGALSNLVAPVMTVFSWFGKLRTLWMAVQTTVLALASSFAVPIAIIAGLVTAGVLLYKNWDTVKEKAGQLKDWAVQKFTELGEGVSNAVESVKNFVSEKWDQLTTSVSDATEATKKAVSDKWNQLKTGVVSIVTAVKDGVVERFTALKNLASSIIEGAKNAVVNTFNAMKTNLTNAVELARSAVVNKFNEIKSGMETAVNKAQSIVKKVFAGLEQVMKNPVEAAQKGIKLALDKITGFFDDLDFSFPKIKLPKLPTFKLKGEFSLNPPSVPKLSVNWNAQGGIFSKPTIFNTPAGLQGVGEAGREAILPLTEKVLGGIGKGIAATLKGGTQQIVVQPQPIYLDGELIANVTFDTINKRQVTASQLAAISRGVQL